MAINIPSSVFKTYNEAVKLFTRTGRLIYPEVKEECPNCYLDTLGTRNRSISFYKPSGPYPFERGMPCPYCGGKGYKDRKSWVSTDFKIDVPDGGIQTISYMTDLDKINKAKYLIPLYDGSEKYDEARFQKAGPSFPQGFKQNETKYVVTFWSRADS